MIVFFVFFLFRPGPLCRACVRATHSVSVIRTLETCGLLLAVISCPQSARLFLVVQSLSLARFLSPRAKAVLRKWPSRYSHWLELCVRLRFVLFKSATCNRQNRRSRCSCFFFYFFFIRVSVFYRYNIISFVRLLLSVFLSPFRSLSFSPSTERPNVT